MKQIDRDIYEYGEVERDAALIADYAPHGGWFCRFYKWIEGIAREEREDLIQQRDEERRRDYGASK
ncbi:hypothetical protein ACTJJ7_15375 [Phyllobacterium sp. 22229]|uniref:hypothetical protein n=1 Tax=Phyllobacterium sp. 22229 TaxID=3453895 RepID=UPI003F844C97